MLGGANVERSGKDVCRLRQGRERRNRGGDRAARQGDLELHLQQAREAVEATAEIEDVNERRRQAATPSRDARYFAARVGAARVMPDPVSTDVVAFGSTVTFERDDGRVQTYRIVGEDEADPAAGSISFVSPVARFLLGKAAGDAGDVNGQGIEIVSIA